MHTLFIIILHFMFIQQITAININLQHKNP